MGSTVTRGGKPSPARCGPVTSSRKRGGERKGVPATQPDRHLPAGGPGHATVGADPLFLPGHQPVPGPDLD
jgi:hypothetical protein